MLSNLYRTSEGHPFNVTLRILDFGENDKEKTDTATFPAFLIPLLVR
jgi:hypothetical protein